MFPSNSNGIDPISIWDGLTILHKPLSSDAIPNSKQEDHLSLFNIPSPFLHYYEDDSSSFLEHGLDLLLPQPQQPASSDDAAVVAHTLVNMVDLNNNVNANEASARGGGGGGNLKKNHSTPDPVPRKRTSKKDRHSKIYTARGPRDRRMRLSLEVAREFFDLQDMLGFDKASKTVEWLLLHSKSAIKELSRSVAKTNSCTAGSASSTSDCDVASGIDEAAGNGDHSASVTQEKPPIKDKKTRQSRRNSFYLLARESRKKARARARERTVEKLWMRRLDGPKPCSEAMKTDLNKSSLYETCEESGIQGSDNVKAASNFLAQSEEPQEEKNLGTTGQTVDDSLAITDRWSPTFNFNNFTSTTISQEHEFRELHLFVKPWEAYNNSYQC